MENRPLKRQQRTVGAIVKIPLEDGYHTYARILESRLAFYNARTNEELPIDEIVKKPVLFVAEVYDDIITEGYWLKIGKKNPIESDLIKKMNEPQYTESLFNGQCTIHYADGSRKKVEKKEVGNLEAAMVWTFESMEQRLSDYYAGRKNREVEWMKQGRPVTGMLEKKNIRKKDFEQV